MELDLLLLEMAIGSDDGGENDEAIDDMIFFDKSSKLFDLLFTLEVGNEELLPYISLLS